MEGKVIEEHLNPEREIREGVLVRWPEGYPDLLFFVRKTGLSHVGRNDYCRIEAVGCQKVCLVPIGQLVWDDVDYIEYKRTEGIDENGVPEFMDPECIPMFHALNKLPGVVTTESCCGHLKDRYSFWFHCTDIGTLSRLARCVDRNYSDGKWELVLDSCDTNPVGFFWLRSKEPFKTVEEMNESVEWLIKGFEHWFSPEFNEYFETK